MALALLLCAFALWWVWPRKKPGDRKRQHDPLVAARARLGVSAHASPEAIEAAFRARLRNAHPDAGGSSEQTRQLTEARALLLASAGHRPQ